MVNMYFLLFFFQGKMKMAYITPIFLPLFLLLTLAICDDITTIEPMPTPANTPEGLLTQKTLLYVVAGKQVELFDDSLVVTTNIAFYKTDDSITDAGPRIERRKLEEYAKTLVTQNVVTQNAKEGDRLFGRLKTVMQLFADMVTELTKVERLFEATDKYFRGTSTPLTDVDCGLQVPKIQVFGRLIRINNSLKGCITSNSAINAKYEIEDGEVKKDSDGKLIQPSEIEIGNAILATEIVAAESFRIVRLISTELIKRQEQIELLLNGRVPAGMLTGMDIRLECLKSGTQDRVQVTGCSQSQQAVICNLETLQKNSGIIAHHMVAVPYFNKGVTLRLVFPPNMIFKKGTGLMKDITDCQQNGNFLRCSSLDFVANDCLEHIQKKVSELPDSCIVEKVPENRPLVKRVEKGTLIAQQSATPLVVTYQGKPITSDPIILSNSEEIELTYGQEAIKVQPLDGAKDRLYLPIGNFTLLHQAQDFLNWKENLKKKWEQFIPLPYRQMLLVTIAGLQMLLIFPLLIRFLDYLVLCCCDRDLKPRRDRGFGANRYTGKPRRDISDSDEDDDDLLHRPVTPKSILSLRSMRSYSSDHSRGRRQNERALEMC